MGRARQPEKVKNAQLCAWVFQLCFLEPTRATGGAGLLEGVLLCWESPGAQRCCRLPFRAPQQAKKGWICSAMVCHQANCRWPVAQSSVPFGKASLTLSAHKHHPRLPCPRLGRQLFPSQKPLLPPCWYFRRFLHGRVARTRAHRSDSSLQAWDHPCLPPSIRNIPRSARPQLGPLILTMSAMVTNVPSLLPWTRRRFLRGFTSPHSKLKKKRQKCCGWTGPLHSPQQ